MRSGYGYDEAIKELTLLLLYLTLWHEDMRFAKVQRSWKDYSFDVLNELMENRYINGSRRAKSVYINDEGD